MPARVDQSQPDSHDHAPCSHAHAHDTVTLGKTAIDPVCGMRVTPLSAKWLTNHQDTAYFFCSSGCLAKFSANPGRYTKPEPVSAAEGTGGIYTCPMHPEVRQTGPGRCPKCGMALEPLIPSSTDASSPELRSTQRELLISIALAVP